MSDLDQYMPGKLMVFKGEDSDALRDEVVLVDIVEYAGDDFELAFNLGRQRVYLKLPAKQLLAALKE